MAGREGMTASPPLFVGQHLIVARDSDGRMLEVAQVLKIGHRWVIIGGWGRADKRTLKLERGRHHCRRAVKTPAGWAIDDA